MNAVHLLTWQHREIEELFRKATATDRRKGQRLRLLFDQIDRALAVHAAIEEEHFYPALLGRRADKSLAESLDKHMAIELLISQLRKTKPADPAFDAKLKVLKGQVERHVRKEEAELFHKATTLIDPTELEQLGYAMRRMMGALEDRGYPGKVVLTRAATAVREYDSAQSHA